jgi:CheY-like chemotaxis protein
LRLPDLDGLELAKFIASTRRRAYIPIIVVSGDVQERLESRSISDDVTDYFDKSLGFGALAAFIKGYVAPETEAGGEGCCTSRTGRVVAMATRRMLEKHGLTSSTPPASRCERHLETMKAQGRVAGPDVVLTDVYLKGRSDRQGPGHVGSAASSAIPKGLLPVLVMTGDANPANQTDLLRAAPTTWCEKPIEERLLVTKLLFQLRVGRLMREKNAVARLTAHGRPPRRERIARAAAALVEGARRRLPARPRCARWRDSCARRKPPASASIPRGRDIFAALERHAFER